MGKLWQEADRKTRAKWLATSAAILLLVLIAGFTLGSSGIEFHSPISTKRSDSETDVVKDSPSEFLFIDIERVASYLAQLEGGTFTKERLSQKVVRSANGEIKVVNALSAGASTEEERFVEREVTPTAASSFVNLEGSLEDRNELETGFLHDFQDHIEDEPDRTSEAGELEDGDFVRFEAVVRGPAYADPYLAVRKAATLSALFPMQGRDPEGRKIVKARRKAAERFVKQVGRNPRVVLSVNPVRNGLEQDVKLLMPVHVRQLNEERSLLRTGGVFTVVGKVVRIFSPAPGATLQRQANRGYAYVDFPTRQAWLHPLRRAAPELICSASLACSRAVEISAGASGARRKRAIELTRRRMIKVLKRETLVEDSGALILPVAIYR